MRTTPLLNIDLRLLSSTPASFDVRSVLLDVGLQVRVQVVSFLGVGHCRGKLAVFFAVDISPRCQEAGLLEVNRYCRGSPIIRIM